MKPVNIKIRKVCSFLLYFVIFISISSVTIMAAEEFSIVVNKTSEVNSEKIYLEDIATIKAPSFLKQEIGAIEIGSSPDPGEIKIILKDRLASKIHSNQLIDKNVLVNVPDKIFVKRLTQRLEIDDLKERFLKYVETFQEDNKFDLRDFSVRGLEPYPKGKLTLLFDKDNRFDGKGRFSIRVDVLVNNYSVDTLSLSGWLDIYEQFVCARVPLERNKIIEAESLYYKKVNTSQLRQNYVKKIENIVGKISHNRIKKGDLIRINLLKQAPLVHRGQAIKLVAKREGLKIITAGISKEDGIADDLIRVENLSSGKIIRGFVKGKSLVEIYY
jgi:flagella basal body P-ring formation protein FlgA